MKKFLTPFFFATLFAAFVAGCSSQNTITAGMQVEITGLARAADGTTQVSWRFVNPNVVSYLIAQTTHRIYLDGVLVGTTNDRNTVAIPAQSKVDQSSALQVAGPAAERALSAAAGAGSAAYRLESVVLIRLYGETTDRTNLTGGGRVPVTAK